MARVALIRCETYNEDEVRQAVRRGIELLGGVGKFARAGERILFKPNVLAGDPPPRCTATHPAVFRAAAELFGSVTTRLTYGDSPGFGKPGFHMRTSGLAKAAEEMGVSLADFEGGRQVRFKQANFEAKLTLAHGALEADGIVSLPKFKTHQLTRITGPVKNQLGCVPGLLKPQYHVRFPRVSDFARMLAALNLLLQPRLYILDAVSAMEGNGPRSGRPVHMGLLMFSEDPVAMETLMCRLIDLDPRFVPTVAAGGELGLGTSRWEEIELVGDSWQEAVKPDFKVTRRAVSSIRQAEAIRRDAELAVQGARRGLDELRVRRSGFLRSLRSTTEHFLAELDEEERRGSDGAEADDQAPESGLEAPGASAGPEEHEGHEEPDDMKFGPDGD